MAYKVSIWRIVNYLLNPFVYFNQIVNKLNATNLIWQNPAVLPP
jgi:hypothetical protein